MNLLIVYLLYFANAYQYKTVLFTRHGARSPDPYTEVDEKQWTIKANRLTQFGYDTFLKLGERNRRPQILDSNGNCDYSLMDIQASVSQRAILSTIGFIKGLCPQNYGNILRQLFNDYYHQYSTNEKAYTKIIQSDFSNPMDLDVTNFERNNDFMFHGHDKAVCPSLKALKKGLEASKFYTDKDSEFRGRAEFDEVFSILQKANPSKTIKKKDVLLTDIEHLFDNYECNHLEGHTFPNPSAKTLSFIEEVVQVTRYYVDHSQPLEEFSALTEPFKWLISALNSELSLSWYSGHGQNLEGILAVITDERPLPGFGSTIEFVVMEEIVNIYYNGIQLPTKFCISKINCTKNQVIYYVSKYIASDLFSICGLNNE